ncbi:uncharacterized protein LOC114872147 [Osmia bicornis bicornis]|uniref:uncharacterized protein LOC114872147 n=1 Tax=Osmia bicornis bicornis TaxID=1437191 RepID=UPI001EAF280A|nr:uncharacterized protein LOC114872147 [Osmia bicornis bicornis]
MLPPCPPPTDKGGNKGSTRMKKTSCPFVLRKKPSPSSTRKVPETLRCIALASSTTENVSGVLWLCSKEGAEICAPRASKILRSMKRKNRGQDPDIFQEQTVSHWNPMDDNGHWSLGNGRSYCLSTGSTKKMVQVSRRIG